MVVYWSKKTDVFDAESFGVSQNSKKMNILSRTRPGTRRICSLSKWLLYLFMFALTMGIAEAGPATCLACTTGACAATLPAGPLAYGICVVEAAATICLAFCGAPIP